MVDEQRVKEIYGKAISMLAAEVEKEDPMILPVSVQHMKDEILQKTISSVSEMLYDLLNVQKVDPAEVVFILAATSAKLMTENFGVMYGRLRELPDQQYVQMFNSWLKEE